MSDIKEEKMLKLLNNNKFDELISAKNLYEIYIEENNIVHLLAVRGNESGIDFFIKQKKDILCTNLKGQNIIHILFKFGYDDLAEKYYKKYPELLKKFDNDLILPIFYCCDRFNSFKTCFKFMKEQNYDIYILFNTVSFYDENIFTQLVLYTTKNDKKEYEYIDFCTKYIDLINFDLPLKNPICIYAITINKNDIAKIFIERNKGLTSKNYMFLLPINIACKNNNIDLVKCILKKNPDITYGGGESEYLPINIAINNDLYDLLVLLDEYIKDYNIIDRYRNTYAHYIVDKLIFFVDNNLLQEERILRKIGFKILQNSDIDIENNDKLTTRELLNQYIKIKEKKKKYKDNNYNEEETKDIKQLKLILNDKDSDTEDIEKNRNFTLIKSKKHFNTGLFGADIFYKTFYLIYLHNKYKSDLFIPSIKYKDDDIKKLLYLINLQTINYNAFYHIISSIYYTTLKYLTPIIPSNILWHSKDLHYIHPELFNIIKKTSKRFVLLTVSLIVGKEFTHANCIIIDTIQNNIRRFEPYGINDMKDEYELDNLIHDNCEKIFKRKFKYYRPEDYIGNIKFQSVSNDSNNNYRKYGDPMGYCLAWCMCYIELKLNNQDIEEKELTYIASENIIKHYKKYDNPYLYFIRDYSRLLSNEKDKLLRKMKINRDELYDINYKQQNLIKIHKYIKNIDFN